MRFTNLMFLAGLFVALAAPIPAHAELSPVQRDMLASFEDSRNKLLELAEATPQEKYTWRPMEGVRSQGEVFLHVAATNFGLPTLWGVKAPKGFAFQGYETSTTDKAEIQAALKASFDHLLKGFRELSEEEMNKPVSLFGNKTTVRGGYMNLIGHVHEHLGQSIAYARTNRIVPPWTARAQAEEKEK
jgi:uncharacterized damage-inducible protein DinB